MSHNSTSIISGNKRLILVSTRSNDDGNGQPSVSLPLHIMLLACAALAFHNYRSQTECGPHMVGSSPYACPSRCSEPLLTAETQTWPPGRISRHIHKKMVHTRHDLRRETTRKRPGTSPIQYCHHFDLAPDHVLRHQDVLCIHVAFITKTFRSPK